MKNRCLGLFLILSAILSYPLLGQNIGKASEKPTSNSSSNTKQKRIIAKFKPSTLSLQIEQTIPKTSAVVYISSYDSHLAILESSQPENDIKELSLRNEVAWARIDTPLDSLPPQNLKKQHTAGKPSVRLKAGATENKTRYLRLEQEQENSNFLKKLRELREQYPDLMYTSATDSLNPSPEWNKQWGLFNPGTQIDYVSNPCGPFTLFFCYDGLARYRTDALIWELRDYIRRIKLSGDKTYASYGKTIIAVVDSGTSFDPLTRTPNPQTINNLWIDPETGAYGRNFVDNEPINYTTSGIDHGPPIEGLLVAKEDGIPPIGITSGDIDVMHLRIFNDKGEGYVSYTIKALDYLIDLIKTRNIPVRVAHHAWSCQSCDESISKELKLRFDTLATLSPLKDIWGNIIRERGVVHVVAAGNIGVSRETDAERALRANLDIQERVPATFDTEGQVVVGGMDPDGTITWFSAYGALRVNIAAPASSIFALDKNGGYTVVDGTSFAVPFVAGTVAEMFNINPKLPARYVKIIINGSGYPNYNLTGQIYSMRTLNAIVAAENAMLSRFYSN